MAHIKHIVNTNYEISDSLVRFHLITARNSNCTWQRTDEKQMGSEYAKIFSAVTQLKKMELVQNVKTIICNSSYAIELFAHGIIEPQMVQLIEEKIAGENCNVTPVLVIPSRKVVFPGVKFYDTSIVITTCHDKDDFEFRDSKDEIVDYKTPSPS